MKLHVVQTGRLRDPAIERLCADYVVRFRRFGQLTISEREPRGTATLWPTSARYRVLLDEGGSMPDSAGLAAQLRTWTMQHGEVAFLIGAAEGHHAPSAAEAQAKLALSRLTLPHRLAHLVLIEQLYRAATILAGLPYHREPGSGPR